jgi:hypothetical protein
MKAIYLTALLILTALFTGFKEPEKTRSEAAIVPTKQDILVLTEDFIFKIKTHNEQEVSGGMTTRDIYLYASEHADSVFIATEIAALTMNDIDSRHLFDMPRDCDISINCYFAGNGSVYHAIAVKNKLAM